jgi:hypothetical protein
MVFSSDGRMRDLIVERFGPPTKKSEKNVTGEILEWRWRREPLLA